jgi:hypothetical protein
LETIIIDLPEAQKLAADGTALVKIRDEITDGRDGEALFKVLEQEVAVLRRVGDDERHVDARLRQELVHLEEGPARVRLLRGLFRRQPVGHEHDHGLRSAGRGDTKVLSRRCAPNHRLHRLGRPAKRSNDEGIQDGAIEDLRLHAESATTSAP